MLSCGQTWLCKLSSILSCLGRMWPVRKAWALLMNLTAMTGPEAFKGIAFRILGAWMLAMLAIEIR